MATCCYRTWEIIANIAILLWLRIYLAEHDRFRHRDDFTSSGIQVRDMEGRAIHFPIESDGSHDQLKRA